MRGLGCEDLNCCLSFKQHHSSTLLVPLCILILLHYLLKLFWSLLFCFVFVVLFCWLLLPASQCSQNQASIASFFLSFAFSEFQ